MAEKAAYDDFYAEQLTELLTQYGPLVEVWFDGAGSQGREYDWQRIIGLVTQYQPEAMVFNMGQPTIRWVGNEDGVAPYPCWNTAGTGIREYVLEAKCKGEWVELVKGSAIGHKKIDKFKAVETSELKVRFVACAAEPIVRKFAAFSVN